MVSGIFSPDSGLARWALGSCNIFLQRFQKEASRNRVIINSEPIRNCVINITFPSFGSGTCNIYLEVVSGCFGMSRGVAGALRIALEMSQDVLGTSRSDPQSQATDPTHKRCTGPSRFSFQGAKLRGTCASPVDRIRLLAGAGFDSPEMHRSLVI